MYRIGTPRLSPDQMRPLSSASTLCPPFTPRAVQALTRLGALTRSMSQPQRAGLADASAPFRQLLALVYARLPSMKVTQVGGISGEPLVGVHGTLPLFLALRDGFGSLGWIIIPFVFNILGAFT